MTEARDFLLEIGVEELPASAALAAAGQAGPAATRAFGSRGLPLEDQQVSVWVSPRRIAIFIEGLPETQSDREYAHRGPAVAAAFDDQGRPTKAAEGFARAKGVSVAQLEVREHKGQEFVFAIRREKGQPATEAIAEACHEIVHGFTFSKTMRWDDSRMRFARPVRWLVAKFGDETIEFRDGTLVSGGATRGHRFLGKGDLVITSASTYRDQMLEAHVVVDQEERRKIILEGLARHAEEMEAEYFDPAGELEEVVFLVENPSVQRGSFDAVHLRLPEEVLVTAMQSHQRYFPLRARDGGLMAGFLHVINADPDHAAEVTRGNERVLEGRIEDAEFSYDKDLATGIEAMRGRLDGVVFHKRLGSLADKTSRLEGLAGALCGMLCLDDRHRDTAVAAAGLAKADLVSIMVQEFPTLEGHMGAAYAAIDAYPADVCKAISDQYLPRSSGGRLPETLPGAVLAICDKVDNLVGAFSVDELPTGSRDPYGLRRAAAGIYEIVRSQGLEFDLAELLAAGHSQFVAQSAQVKEDGSEVTAAIMEFVFDRIQQRMVEAGVPVAVVDAARAAGQNSVRRFGLLTEAIEEFRQSPAFEDLHTAYFRCSKIAARAGEESSGEPVDPALFEEEAEELLNEAYIRLRGEIESLTAADDFIAAMEVAAKIRPLVDRFFDDVLVMAEEDDVRRNRLALVSGVAAAMQLLGDPMQAAAAPAKGAGG